MTAVDGMLSIEQLRHQVDRQEIDTVLVVFTDLYGRFVGKRLDADFFLNRVTVQGTHACDYLLTVDMEMNPVAGYAFANWQKGYGDVHLVPDLATLRCADWLERSAMVVCDLRDRKTGTPVAVAPRTILARQVHRAAAAGFGVMAGSELEYYLFRQSYRQAHRKNYHHLKTAGWYLEDYHMLQGSREEDFTGAVRRHLSRSGVPVESSKGEWGAGQHEINVQFADALTMADRHGVYKQCLKEVADRMGASVTFMAKFDTDQAGSSCHIHMSLVRDGRSAFAGDQAFGPLQCSPVFKSFLAGWMAHVPEMMVFYAPTVNSYKRYRSGSWAPTRMAWSVDNRTAGFRVVGGGQSLRIECRIPGADCNPYLAFAAAIASGLDGIERKLEPPPPFTGDMYAADDLARLPASLDEAAAVFSGSDFVKKMLGDDVVAHYTHFFQVEQHAFDRAVTDWERRRYFERI